MPPLNRFGMHAPVTITVPFSGAAAGQLDLPIFISDGYYEIVEARSAHAVAGGSNAAVQLRVHSSGVAIASGTAVLAVAFDLTATAVVPVVKSISNGGITKANALISPGQMLSADFSGTLTALVGPTITIVLRRTRINRDR